MSFGNGTGDRRTEAVKALLKVRDAEHRQAKGRLQKKRIEVRSLELEIDRIRKRRGELAMRRGSDVLKERLLLDALVKAVLERKEKLAAASLQAAVLLAEYRDARARKDAAGALRARREAELERALERKSEEAATDMAAARGLRDRAWEEGAWEER